jgi:hypothetical protein
MLVILNGSTVCGWSVNPWGPSCARCDVLLEAGQHLGNVSWHTEGNGLSRLIVLDGHAQVLCAFVVHGDSVQ